MQKDKRARSFLFTENDSVQIDVWRERLEGRTEWQSGVRYCICQLEKGEKGGHIHLQGYIELNKSQRFSWLKKNLSKTAHWETRRGTREQARDYCRKEETRRDGPWEYGNWNAGGSGTRNDLAEVGKRVKEGTTIEKIADEFPVEFIKYNRGIRELASFYEGQRDPEQAHKVHFFYGPPGCGKTSKVIKKYPDAYFKSAGNKWFDGYTGEDVICYDDFNHGWVSIDMLCRLLDRYPVRVEGKGYTRQLNNRTSIITSNTLPSAWYNWDKHGGQVRLNAILRRITFFRAWYAVGKSRAFDNYADFLTFIDNPINMEF